jgi:hypothetical protein
VPSEVIKQELEHQKKEKHGCGDMPCLAMRQIRAALDAIERGEPAKAHIEDEWLYLEIGERKDQAIPQPKPNDAAFSERQGRGSIPS